MSESQQGPGAGETLAGMLMSALQGLALNGVYDAAPLQAAFPYCVVDCGPETDWSHKSGTGREVRVAVILRDKNERPSRLRALMRDGEAAIGGVGPEQDGWRLVTMQFLRSRLLREPGGHYAGVIEYRARMLAEAGGDS